METSSFKAKSDDQSFGVFLEQIRLRPPDFISGGNDLSIIEERNSPPISLKDEEPELFKFNGKEEVSVEPEAEGNSFESFLKKADTKSAEPKKENLPNEEDPPFMNSFLIELVHSVKNTLASIYHTTLVTMDKADDVEIRKHSRVKIKEDIKKIDSVLNSLLNFININTPIAKTNTLYTILEEVLEANQKQLHEKNIQIMKRCEKDLPETYIHNEQVRFILHSIVQYAIFSTPPNESIGLIMKSLDFHDAMDTQKDSSGKKKGYVEVVVGFDGGVKLTGPLENLLKMPEDQRQATDLILILANEILTKNRGSMSIESNGKRPKTLITLRVPIERRNVVYYAPINI